MQRMAGTAFIIRVASAAVVFLSQILLARWMGSFEFGIYVYVWTWLLLVGDIVHLGLPLTAQRHIPEYTQHGALDLLRGYPDRQPLAHVRARPPRVALLGAAAMHALEGVARPARHHAALSRLRGAAVLHLLVHARRRRRAPTTGSRWRCCRIRCCGPILHARADGRRLCRGLAARRHHRHGGDRHRDLDARRSASSLLLDRPARQDRRARRRGPTTSAAGSRPRCRSSRCGASTRC